MTLIAGAEPKRAVLVAHTLKGAAAALGLTRLSASAAALESALRQGQPPPALASLEDNCHAELAALQADLSRLEEALETQPVMAVDPVQAQNLLDQLDAMLASSNTAANAFYRTAQAMFRQILGEAASQLGRQIEDYDYPLARATLRTARNSLDSLQR